MMKLIITKNFSRRPGHDTFDKHAGNRLRPLLMQCINQNICKRALNVIINKMKTAQPFNKMS